MKAKDWAMYIALGAIWGSSFMWIKIALGEVGPFALVAFRLGFGLLGMVAVVALLRPPIPRERRLWLGLAFIGVTNMVLPFLLITWGEQFIDSGVAAVLNGAMPLFTLVIAHFFLADERITLIKALGLLIGFAGLVLLVGRDLGQVGRGSAIIGQLAVVLATVSYATGAVFTRKHLGGVSPLFQPFASLVVADLIAWLAVPPLETLPVWPSLGLTWLALAWLGLLGTCLAYILFFSLIQNIGATRASTVTYVIPVVGVILGVIFLREQLDWHLVGGTLLVIAGVWIVNTKLRPAFLRGKQVSLEEAP
jgi:drug/metabolite transporter (DMT)-like permease